VFFVFSSTSEAVIYYTCRDSKERMYYIKVRNYICKVGFFLYIHMTTKYVDINVFLKLFAAEK